jgi:hypothetical protein
MTVRYACMSFYSHLWLLAVRVLIPAIPAATRDFGLLGHPLVPTSHSGIQTCNVRINISLRRHFIRCVTQATAPEKRWRSYPHIQQSKWK